MEEYRGSLGGVPWVGRVPRTADDILQFRDWLADADSHGPIALDTESTGLDLYSSGFRLRTVQFGDEREAWVLRVDNDPEMLRHAEWALDRTTELLVHNMSYDVLLLDQHTRISAETLFAKTTDTRILAALVDPRQPQEGGIGTGLKPLSAHYIDADAPDTQAGLHAVFRKHGLTRETGWAGIPLDDPTYTEYAALDVILTSRLFRILNAKHYELGIRPTLVQYEHEIARICATMQRTGMVLDLDYVEALDQQLCQQAEHYAAVAMSFGVESVNATAQVADVLLAMGVPLTERTPSGAWKVDKAILTSLSDMTLQGERLNLAEPNPLAEAVYYAKRAGKWRSAYVETFKSTVDPDGRIHPSINPLQARTARMSITRPALQTLPSGDAMIRRAMLADEGHVIVSVDFAAVELRVLAALADVRRMKEAIGAGEDLHSFTARLVYGDAFTAKHRKICKGVGLGKVFGGGAATISRQTGVGIDEVRRALTAYDSAYPEIKRAARRWEREARAHGMVTVSVTGRRLPLDPERAYAVTNYQVQSAARDVLGQALINMDEAGLLPYLRLPIHDEVLASVPQRDAQELAQAIQRCMTMDLGGVPITADGEIGKRSWGSLYGADV